MPESCVVTGSSSGIGQAIARRLQADGWRVLGVDLEVSPESEIETLSADVAEPDTARRAADLAERSGLLTGWVNCAGIVVNQSAAELTQEATRRQFDVNALGTAWGCAVAVQRMLAHGSGGSIVNVSSVQAQRSMPGTFAYAATKAAVDAMARQIAIEYAGDGIRANSVLPGAVSTPLNEAKFAAQPDPDQAREREAWLAPVGRLGESAEVAACVAWLLSDESSFVTGHSLGVDGGAAAWLTSSATRRDRGPAQS